MLALNYYQEVMGLSLKRRIKQSSVLSAISYTIFVCLQRAFCFLFLLNEFIKSTVHSVSVLKAKHWNIHIISIDSKSLNRYKKVGVEFCEQFVRTN